MEIKEALTFNDVLLVPGRTNITSRNDTSIKTKLSRNIDLNIPIVSANMDTVTESEMAKTIARHGGIGIIHRFLTLDQQVQQVEKVKRAEGIIIEKPHTLTPNRTVQEAINLMQTNGISGLLITDPSNKLVGILTKRDLLFETNSERKVSELMTKNLITANPTIHIDDAKKILKQNKIEKLPLIDEEGNLKGLITTSDIIKRTKYPDACKDKKGRLRVGAAIGVKDGYLERAESLLQAGCDVLVIDIAHGHAETTINVIKTLRENFGKVEIIAGNVATSEATKDLIDAGADAIKVGVGPGCFAAGTRVLLSNGTYKNIEKINSGDKVINQEGKPVVVKSAFSTGIRKVQKIRSSTFYEDTYVTPDHKYFVGDLNTVSVSTIHNKGYASLLEQQSKTVPKISKYKWKQIQELKQDVLLMPKNINFELNQTFKVYRTDVLLTPTYELGYILGTFLGDGSAHTAKIKNNSNIGSVRWYFGKNEVGIAEKLADCIKKAFNKELKFYYEKKIILSILYHKPLAELLKGFGKKTNKHLPSEYLVNNKEYLKGLLDGMIDSDGTIEENGRIRFTNTSKKLIELFGVLCYLVNGFFPDIDKREIRIVKNNQMFIRYRISHEPKVNAEIRLTKNYQAIKLLESEQTEIETRVYDLEIDCPTHSFIANNAIVHNSICITRLVAGAGVPQLTAVMNCAKTAKDYNIPIIADGGIKTSGDIAKAIAAGASSVMIGSMFAGTDESPGMPITRNGQKYKLIRGMASLEAAMERSKKEGKKEKEFDQVVPEGVEATVPYRGSVKEMLTQLTGGLRSGMSYCGARTIPEMWAKAKFVKITSAGWQESNPHDVKLR